MKTAVDYREVPGMPGLHQHSYGPDNSMGRWVIWRDAVVRTDGKLGGTAFGSADTADEALQIAALDQAKDGRTYGVELSWSNPHPSEVSQLWPWLANIRHIILPAPQPTHCTDEDRPEPRLKRIEPCK